MTRVSLWREGRGRDLLSLESSGHIPTWNPECPSEVSSTWSSEVHVVPHSEPGDVSAWEFTSSLPLYQMWGLEGSSGFRHSTALSLNLWGLWGHQEVTDLSMVTQQIKGGSSPGSVFPKCLSTAPPPAPLCFIVHFFLLSCEDFLHLQVSSFSSMNDTFLMGQNVDLRVEWHNRLKPSLRNVRKL